MTPVAPHFIDSSLSVSASVWTLVHYSCNHLGLLMYCYSFDMNERTPWDVVIPRKGCNPPTRSASFLWNLDLIWYKLNKPKGNSNENTTWLYGEWWSNISNQTHWIKMSFSSNNAANLPIYFSAQNSYNSNYLFKLYDKKRKNDNIVSNWGSEI